MGSAEVLVSKSGFGDYNFEVSWIAYCDTEVIPKPLRVVLDMCTSENVASSIRNLFKTSGRSLPAP
jgi:hypothetical protein